MLALSCLSVKKFVKSSDAPNQAFHNAPKSITIQKQRLLEPFARQLRLVSK
jgi:hypothetical protein